MEDDKDSAGVGAVDGGGDEPPFVLILASASETAVRYEDAEAMREELDFFVNIEVVGECVLRAIGEGIVEPMST